MNDVWNAPPSLRTSKSAPSSPAKPLAISRTRSESFHALHKVPMGDTPYVRAKNVQLVEKDPEKAIPLFWAAINAGDRVDSALKDMAIVMKQQNRPEEAIEAIKSLRTRCSDQAQESLDNILLDLYKRCGRLDDQIGLLKHKLFLIQQGMAFNGKRTKTARSQGKKFQVSVEQEGTRLLGNLGWALMQKEKYAEAEDAYRRALTIAPDNNKMCNLGICLMKQGRISEAKDTLRRVKPAVVDGPRGVDSHLKAYERSQQMLKDLESEMMSRGGDDQVEQRKLFEAIFGSSSIWQPQPCRDQGVSTANAIDENAKPNPAPPMPRTTKQTGVPDSFLRPASLSQAHLSKDHSLYTKPAPNREDGSYGDENINVNVVENLVRVPFPPLHRSRKQFEAFSKSSSVWEGQSNSDKKGDEKVSGSEDSGLFPPHMHKNMSAVNYLNVDAQPFVCTKLMSNEKLKRTRSGNGAASLGVGDGNTRRRLSLEKTAADGVLLLPDNKDFEEAMMAAVLGTERKTGSRVLQRLKVFQDITLSLSPRD